MTVSAAGADGVPLRPRRRDEDENDGDRYKTRAQNHYQPKWTHRPDCPSRPVSGRIGIIGRSDCVGPWGTSVFLMATFEAVYREHAQAVFRFAMRVTGKREVAEDLVSEAFLALYRNFDAIDQTQLPAWLLTVVRNRNRACGVTGKSRAVLEQFGGETTQEPVEPGILETVDLKPIHNLFGVAIQLRDVAQRDRAPHWPDGDTSSRTSSVCVDVVAQGIRRESGMTTAADGWDSDEQDLPGELKRELEELASPAAIPLDVLRAGNRGPACRSSIARRSATWIVMPDTCAG